VVLVPQAQVSAPNAPGPIFDPVEFAVRFRENSPVAQGPGALAHPGRRLAARALDAARRERLSGKSLAAALGFDPQYLLVTVSPPREGHCYKVCAAILPRG